jgi:PAS domain S-box-containing protein
VRNHDGVNFVEMHHNIASELPYLAMSAVVAIFGSWTALGLFRRAGTIAGQGRAWWVAAAAVAQGLSIWSMHFVAMLGWDPGAPVRYDAGVTAISLVIPILACGGAFWLAASGRLGGLNRPLAALALGAAICAMHYVGMAALRSAVRVGYDPWIVLLSFLIAVAAAYGALWALARQLVRVARAVSAAALGLGIVAMHYTGMAAMRVSLPPTPQAPLPGLNPLLMAMDVGVATLVLLVMAVVVAVFDRKLQTLAEREASAIRRSEQFLRALVEQMPVGVIVAEARNGRLRHVNAEAERLLGLKPDGEARTLDAMAFPPLARAVRRGERAERDLIQYDRVDGEARWLEVSAGPVRDEAGIERFAVAAFTDITDQRKAEAALRQAQRMEAIGQLTGGVAHDFNNLLTAVMGGISLASKRVQDEKARSHLDNAMHAARRGAALVAQLLAFSRQQRLESRPVDVNGLVQGMASLLTSTLGGAIGVSIQSERAPLFALADPTQLELAVLNLAINARDAMPDGGALFISTARQKVQRRGAAHEPEPGDYAVVTVKDTGSGIPPEVIERVFDPFFTTKPVGKGSGMGLSQVLGLAQQMGGGVQIWSAPGGGTKVSVFLPLAEAPSSHAATEPPQRFAGPELPARGRVLILDDDEDVLRFVGNALEDAGYEIASAASVDAALARVRKGWRPDLMVIDYAMPQITGEAAAHALREAGVTAKALFITGYSDLETLKGAHVLQKPFEPQDLVRRLAELDELRGAAKSRAAAAARQPRGALD